MLAAEAGGDDDFLCQEALGAAGDREAAVIGDVIDGAAGEVVAAVAGQAGLQGLEQ